MKDTAMLTWIIPVYNGEKYLAQAIDSILRQPCGDFEVLVIDDGSTDNSLKIARSYTDSRVKAIHQENGGVSSARNLGIENAASRYIAFLDADDVLCRNAYDEEIHNILSEEKYDLLSFSYYCGDQHLKYGNKRTVVPLGEGMCDETQLDPFKHFCSLIYRYSLFEGEKAVSFPVGIKIMEDIAFHFMIHYRADNIINIDRDWFVYRNNSTSAIHYLSNPENILRYSVAAWYWCKSQCETETARNHCDILAFATMSEYIRMGCMNGLSAMDIQKAFRKPEIQETLDNYDILWNRSKAVYEAFMQNPGEFWIKQRVKGILAETIRFFARLPILRGIYMRLKYKENIECLV